MPSQDTTSSVNFEVEWQLLATSEFLSFAASAIRSTQFVSQSDDQDAKALRGLATALDDRAAVLCDLQERFAKGV